MNAAAKRVGVHNEVRGRISGRNAALIKTIALGLLAVSFAGCMGYVPGRQSYWDAQVHEMCEKEAGITIYERIKVSKKEYDSLGGMPGGLPLPPEWHKPDFPYFIEVRSTRIRESNPEVVKTEMFVKRRSDRTILGKSVTFSRRGGDIPTGLFHTSSFTCAETGPGLTKQIFEVARDAQ